MSDFYPNMYRLIAGIVVVLIFFVTGRPYFSIKVRVFLAAITAGLLNAFAGGAMLGTPLSDLWLRFVIAFVGVGAGVALLEMLFPEGGAAARRLRRGG
jgi:hypothetical protein